MTHVKVTRIVRRNSGKTEDHHFIPVEEWAAMTEQEQAAVLPVPSVEDRDVIDCRRTVTEET